MTSVSSDRNLCGILYRDERQSTCNSSYKDLVATATNNVHLSSREAQTSQAMERGPGFLRIKMTLTYRGSSYDIGSKLPLVQPVVELQYRGKAYKARTSAAPAQVHATLTFRGISYAK